MDFVYIMLSLAGFILLTRKPVEASSSTGADTECTIWPPVLESDLIEYVERWREFAQTYSGDGIGERDILAIIANESAGCFDVDGDAGEIGLMQVMFDAYLDAQAAFGFSWSYTDLVDNPELQVATGAYYLRGLYTNAQTLYPAAPLESAVKSYNIGPGNFASGIALDTAADYWSRFLTNKDRF